jgi:hypothetical protein
MIVLYREATEAEVLQLGKTAEMGLKKATLSVRITLTDNQVYYHKLGYEFMA